MPCRISSRYSSERNACYKARASALKDRGSPRTQSVAKQNGLRLRLDRILNLTSRSSPIRGSGLTSRSLSTRSSRHRDSLGTQGSKRQGGAEVRRVSRRPFPRTHVNSRTSGVLINASEFRPAILETRLSFADFEGARETSRVRKFVTRDVDRESRDVNCQ